MPNVLAEKLTRECFRERYADRKPAFELIDGVPEQKALGSKRHARLQGILCRILEELGFRSYTELTLEIGETWEPVPDVAGTLGPEIEEIYQSQPPAVVIEILSPSDRFTLLDQKCRRYAEWGVADILVFDPAGCRAWHWNPAEDGLVPLHHVYRFSSQPGKELSLPEVFQRLEGI